MPITDVEWGAMLTRLTSVEKELDRLRRRLHDIGNMVAVLNASRELRPPPSNGENRAVTMRDVWIVIGAITLVGAVLGFLGMLKGPP